MVPIALNPFKRTNGLHERTSNELVFMPIKFLKTIEIHVYYILELSLRFLRSIIMNFKKLPYNHGGFILVLCGYLFYKEPTVLDFIYITNVVEPLNKGYFILFYFI